MQERRRRVVVGLPGKVRAIGHDLVRCGLECPGIHLNPAAGIIPRCLILEGATGANRDQQGAIVVGLNPGRTSPEEATYYRQRGIRYRSLTDWWDRELNGHPYYLRIRPIVRSLGIAGPILWTDIAKCELPEGGENGDLPDATLATCGKRFLRRELRLAELKTWPVFALSGRTYRFIRANYPGRTVIGLLHPTGTRGDLFWSTLNDSRNGLRRSYERDVQELLARGGAVWVGSAGLRWDDP